MFAIIIVKVLVQSLRSQTQSSGWCLLMAYFLLLLDTTLGVGSGYAIATSKGSITIQQPLSFVWQDAYCAVILSVRDDKYRT